jgi:maltoporin
MDGWSQTILAKGTGLNTNRGVNFGSWVNGFSADAESTFFSTYGVANLTDKLQMGSEITRWDLKDVWGQDSVKRTLFAVRPSYIVNNNLRLEFTAGVGIEELSTPSAWGRADKSVTFKTFEFAPVLTANADYFGRPQIKPYVTYYKADSGYGNQIGLANSKDSDLVFGVQSEIWF